MSKTKSYDIDKHIVYDAYLRVKANKGSPGIDKLSIEGFEEKLKDNLFKIWNRMSSGSYFPSPVMTVEIPKSNGGTRKLGIPTVGDRIAQMVAKMYLEPKIEKIFHKNSYGYRPGKSAHQAVGQARKRCWKYKWVVDMDIKGFFDNIDHDLMMAMVEKHTTCQWLLLYIKRWLKAPAQLEDGTIIQRDMGTPQGGVISPLLANIFLHHAFDSWITENHPQVLFERYADDIICHCQTENEARQMKSLIEQRLAEFKLKLHPEKTKIVYCRIGNQKSNYPEQSFDFLGFTFCTRTARNKYGKLFNNFLPAISDKSKDRIKQKIREWKIHLRSDLSLDDIAEYINPTVRGWINYYGAFSGSKLYQIGRQINFSLAKWARRKYKKLKSRNTRAFKWLDKTIENRSNLFVHWELKSILNAGK
jgi:RNA-directed DNA polymerase